MNTVPHCGSFIGTKIAERGMPASQRKKSVTKEEPVNLPSAPTPANGVRRTSSA